MINAIIPPVTDPRWRDLVTGKIVKPWHMLALKILMIRINNSTRFDPSPSNVDRCVWELHSFFERNIRVAELDLMAVFQ